MLQKKIPKKQKKGGEDVKDEKEKKKRKCKYMGLSAGPKMGEKQCERGGDVENVELCANRKRRHIETMFTIEYYNNEQEVTVEL